MSTLRTELARKQEEHAAHPICYRLYTEDRANVPTLVATLFRDATILYHTVGLWQGETQLSRVIEILGTRADLPKVRELAELIRQANHQTAVYLTRAVVELESIEGAL